MRLTLALGCALLLAAPVMAGSFTIATDASDPNETSGLTGFATYGGNNDGVDGGPGYADYDMDGMEITAIFSDGTSETAIWKTTGPLVGAAVGLTGTGGWSLTEAGHTYWPGFDNTFDLVNSTGKTMTRLVLDGGPGDTVFDRYTNRTFTSGSADGGDAIPFSLDGTDVISSGPTFKADGTYAATFNGALDLHMTATYKNPVALTGKAPKLDLWRVLEIDFGSGFHSGRTFSFGQDSDNLAISGDITTTTIDIPEPGTMVLLVLGLGGLAVARRRRTRSS